jgi:hypothetical protein
MFFKILPIIALICIGITFYWKFNDPEKLVMYKEILPYSDTNNVVMDEGHIMWIDIEGRWFVLANSTF